MVIRKATPEDIPVIHRLAHETWWPTYDELLSAEQIGFMLEDMYSEESLLKQFDELEFFIAERENIPVAFAGISLTDADQRIWKLHKLYVLPQEQGKGTGKSFIEFIADLVLAKGAAILELNVNRANPALGFYCRLGFEIYQEVDIPYHRFWLNDYVMRKAL